MTDATAAISSPVPDPLEAPPLRWGILAAGSIAHQFARDVPRHSSGIIAAVGSRNLERAQAFADEFDGPRAYGSYEELVADPEIDAIYIASPQSEHRNHAILALEAGKPILMEKPFTRNAREAREVFAVAERKGLFVMEAMWSRFLPHYKALADVIASGKIGEVTSVTAAHFQCFEGDPNHRLWNAELAGGALLDLGVYPISFIHALLGKPDSIHAFGALSETGVDEFENVVLRYGERVTAVALSGMRQASAPNRAVVGGVEGSVEVGPWFFTPSNLSVSTRSGESYEIPGEVPAGFQYQAAEVARCIDAGVTQSETMSWQDTLEVMEIMDEVRAQLGVVFPGE